MSETPQSFLARLWAWWQAHKDESVALKKALAVIILSLFLGFYSGRQKPEDDYARLEDEMVGLHSDFRELAAVRDDSERELRRLRLQAKLDVRTIEKLREHSKALSDKNLRQLEEAIFYRSILGRQSRSGLNVYVLEETPDFHPRVRRLSAALVLPQKKFKGSYYFEAVTSGQDGGEELVRVPEEGNVPLEFTIYTEIEQTVELPAGINISKLRLVVLDNKSRTVADEVLDVESEEEEEESESEPSLPPTEENAESAENAGE